MSEHFTDEACIALVAVDLENSRDMSTYIVGCASPEETRMLLLDEYEREPHIEIIVLKLPADDAKNLRLTQKEIRPWD